MQGCVPLFLAVWPNDSPRHLVLTPLIAATGKTSMSHPDIGQTGIPGKEGICRGYVSSVGAWGGLG